MSKLDELFAEVDQILTDLGLPIYKVDLDPASGLPLESQEDSTEPSVMPHELKGFVRHYFVAMSTSKAPAAAPGSTDRFYGIFVDSKAQLELRFMRAPKLDEEPESLKVTQWGRWGKAKSSLEHLRGFFNQRLTVGGYKPLTVLHPTALIQGVYVISNPEAQSSRKRPRG